MKIFACSALLFSLLGFSAYAVAQEDQHALDSKLEKTLIMPAPFIPADIPTTFSEDSPVFGGYLVHGGYGFEGAIVNDKDAVCRLKALRPHAFMFTDQEGGVVRRYQELRIIGAHNAAKKTREEYYESVLKHSKTLKEMCIDVNLAPVVNVSRTAPVPRSHPRKIDEKRTYSADINVVKEYAGAFAEATYDAGLIPTAKHFPGDVIIDEVAFDSPYLASNRGFRWEMNFIDTDYPIKDNIDAFFFGKPQFLMWSNNIFKKYSDKPAFMVDEFKQWLDEKDCQCLIISDALNEVKLTEDVVLKAFQNADLVIIYGSPEIYLNLVKNLVKQGKISEADIDKKLARIERVKKIMKELQEKNGGTENETDTSAQVKQ